MLKNVRNQVEECTSKEELELRAIFASSPDAITVSDLNGNIIECNQATLDLHGYSSKEELIGKNGLELIAKKDHEKALKNMKEILERGSIRNIEYTFLTRDGREFSAELSANVIEDPTGNPTGFVAITKDISERKKIEHKLRESEKKFREIFENANDMIIYGDLKGTILDLNPRAAELTGMKRENIVGRNFRELGLVSLRDVPNLLGRLAQKALGRETEGFQITITGKNGEKRLLEVNSALLKKNNLPVGFMAIARDITEREKAEGALRESEQRFRCLVEDAAVGVGIVDLKGRFTYVNKTLATSLGYSAQEFLGRPFKDFLHPDDRGKIVRLFLKSILFRRQLQNIEFRVIRKDGLILHWISRPTRLILNGKTVGFQAIITDITERKKAEEALIESEEKYRNLFENARDVIFTSDLRGNITDVNNTVEEYGFKKGEVIGKNQLKFIPKKYWPRILTTTAKAVRGEPVEGEIEISTPKGKQIVEYKSNPIKLKGKIVGLQTILRGITERKKMEETLKEYAEHLEDKVEERTRELKAAQDQLLKAERLVAIGEVAAKVGHDLRNPLQSIENAAYYLNNELPSQFSSDPIPQKLKEMLKVINDSVNYADKIICDLQDFSAPRKPRLQQANINAIIEETLLQIEIPKNVKVVTELSNLPEIAVDMDMMKRVFLNLALNGIQAMENGGTLRVSTRKTGSFIEARFRDSGIGISEENMERVFIPFFTTKAKGMGMGLPICKGFVESHGGSVEIESEVGKGATFTVKLPIHQQTEVKTND